MKKIFLLIPVMLMTVISCQNSGTGDSQAKSDENIPAIKPFLKDIDRRASEDVSTITDHYLHVQQALVNSDSAGAKAGAAMILNEIKKFDTMILQGNQRTEYNKYRQNIISSAENLSAASGIAMQRTAFKDLSENVYGLVKAFGYRKTLYWVHCPMAFNHQGANWLSTENEVRNPYYGKDMLECGTVEQAIKV